MIELDSTVEEETTEDRVPLFSIDGTTYDIPTEIKPHVALKYLWLLKERGSDYATAWLMETVLGKDGFQALVNYEQLTPAQFNAIKDAVQEAALGATEDRGKAQKARYSGNGSKKSRGSRTTSKTSQRTSASSTT
jgi:hypothetical protein